MFEIENHPVKQMCCWQKENDINILGISHNLRITKGIFLEIKKINKNILPKDLLKQNAGMAASLRITNF